ncbi:hypothetical protein C8Q77DRAFT_1104688 [Trametes polyzona]|nr:hypothetical protein C8Q77DRAFT_1104688 [Trametes polyzona]
MSDVEEDQPAQSDREVPSERAPPQTPEPDGDGAPSPRSRPDELENEIQDDARSQGRRNRTARSERRPAGREDRRPPDFTSWEFELAREAIIEKGQADDEQQAADHLLARWWRMQEEEGRQERGIRDRGTPSRPQQSTPRSRSAAAGTEEPSRNKEKGKGKALPAIPRGVPPPKEFLRPILPYARSRLRDFKHVDLFYFTEEGLKLAIGDTGPTGDESITLSQSDAAITLSTAPKAPRHAKQDEHLSWDQVSKAKALFLRHAEAEGWSDEHLEILALFFLALDNHPIRSEPFRNEVVVRYQAQYRRQWHVAMDRSKPFDLSVINEQALRDIRTELVQEQSWKAQEQIARAMQALEVEQSVARTPKRRRAQSPDPTSPSKRRRRKEESDEDGGAESPPERRGRSFRQGATTYARVICAICLGRHSIAKVGLCQKTRLWNGDRARTERIDKRIRLINGGPLCISWQRPAGCTATDHPERHRCSGCAREGHGASGCPLAEAE